MLFPAEQGLKLKAEPVYAFEEGRLSMLFPAEQGLKPIPSLIQTVKGTVSQCYFQQNKD